MDTLNEILHRKTSIPKFTIGFCRFLRKKNFTISPLDEALLLEAMKVVSPFANETEFMLCMQTVLVKKRDQLDSFENLFWQYSREQKAAANSKLQHKAAAPQKQKKSFEAIKSWLHGHKEKEEIEMARHSAQESLAKRDFADITEEEVKEMEELIELLAKTIARKWNRRYKSNKKGAIDLRASMRLSLAKGGELFDLRRKKKSPNRMRLLLVCDVSRSMDLYSKFFIQFVHSFQQFYKQIETFLFSTDLHRVTKILQGHSFSEAVEFLSEHEKVWKGGTKIGHCLQALVEDYSFLLNQQTMVLIISDGWDTGSEAILGSTMRKIKNRSKKVIWLNPLAGHSGFKPETQGMQEALPFIDHFQSAHNASSLKKAMQHIR